MIFSSPSDAQQLARASSSEEEQEEREGLLAPNSGESTSSCTNYGYGNDLSFSSPLTRFMVDAASVSVTTQRNGKHVRQFYDTQNLVIQSLIETEALHRQPSSDDSLHEGASSPPSPHATDEAAAEEERHTQRALSLSFYSNVALLFIRVTIAALSGSLSLLVTTLDAVLDVISGTIICITARASTQRDKYKYPIGNGRMAPLGVLVFSTIMGTAGMSIIAEGCNQLYDGPEQTEDVAPIGIIVGSSVAVIVMKGILWLFCRNSKNPSVQAFAMDHINDVVVNSAGLVGAVLGRYVLWWTDPATAIVMSIWLIWAWGTQAYENLMSLAGMSAPPQLQQKLTYVALHHQTDLIREIDTVRAYSFGADTWLVEVDVVVDPELPTRAAQAVGEALQQKLERLPEVARAYVRLRGARATTANREAAPVGCEAA